MTGDDTAVDRCRVAALRVSAPHPRYSSAAERRFQRIGRPKEAGANRQQEAAAAAAWIWSLSDGLWEAKEGSVHNQTSYDRSR